MEKKRVFTKLLKSPLVYTDKISLPYLIRYLNLNLKQCRIAIKQKQPTKNINEYKREIYRK